MIVVTTPTGKIGSKLVEQLLFAETAVRVIARDPAKLPSEFLDNVEVVKGSSDDESVLLKAFEGADSLFWVVPPSFNANNDKEYYLKFTQPACRAIKERGVKRVVAVSGLGRGVPVKAGPVTASFAKDAEIEKTGVDFRALWCPGFMENMLSSLATIKEQGVFFVPSPPPKDAVCCHARYRRCRRKTASRPVLDWSGWCGGAWARGPVLRRHGIDHYERTWKSSAVSANHRRSTQSTTHTVRHKPRVCSRDRGDASCEGQWTGQHRTANSGKHHVHQLPAMV